MLARDTLGKLTVSCSVRWTALGTLAVGDNCGKTLGEFEEEGDGVGKGGEKYHHDSKKCKTKNCVKFETHTVPCTGVPAINLLG